MLYKNYRSAIGDNIPEFSVKEISQQVKHTVEEKFSRVRIRGEASGISRPSSGHVYFKLVQEQHQIDAIMWKSRASAMQTPLVDGIEYVATGKITTYSARSSYQLIIDKIEEAGEGALLARLEKLKAELQAEGLFDSKHKQPIPVLPEVIGVVSSPGGAVIRDIMHVLRDRFPRRVILWPVAVQGANCPTEVARAIQGFNKLIPNDDIPRPDVIIVARGGGSVEDLAGFSDETVVRAAFHSKIPLISAVGHETDTPLIDLAADLRAPTPSVAAEKAVPSRVEMAVQLSSFETRMTETLNNKTRLRQQRLRDLSRGLSRQEALFGVAAQRLDLATQSLVATMRNRCQEKEIRFTKASAKLRQPENITSAESRLSVASSRLRSQLINGLIQDSKSRLDGCADYIEKVGLKVVELRQQRLSELDRLLETLSYSQVLKRGYAVVKNQDSVMDSSTMAGSKQSLTVEFHDGSINVNVIDCGPIG